MTNRIAIITGGSRGLGRNTAVNLTRRAVDILFTYRANQKEADRFLCRSALAQMPGTRENQSPSQISSAAADAQRQH